jgi:ribonuclease P/MRP protein subunit RPP1
MRKFADLHLEPDFSRKEQMDRLIQTASDLGFSLVGVSLSPRGFRDSIDFLSRICKDYGMDFASRIDLAPKSSSDLLKNLRRFRRRFEVVAVRCFSKGLARQAAKDHRVDILIFPSEDPRRRFFDNAEAKLASQATAALEINLAMLLRATGFSRTRLLSCLRKEVAIAEKFDIPVVLSSSAVHAIALRGPSDLASLSSMFGMDNASALDAVSTVPCAIVDKNRKKLDSSYVARGVRILRSGKNCDA